MKKNNLTPKEKVLCSVAVAAFGLWGWFAHKVNEEKRRGGLLPEQKMTLVKKDVIKREMDERYRSAVLDGGVNVSKDHVQLSFDTDGNINTVEVIAFPEYHDGKKEASVLKLGDQKTFQNWEEELEKVLPWYEKTMVGQWFYKKVR